MIYRIERDNNGLPTKKCPHEMNATHISKPMRKSYDDCARIGSNYCMTRCKWNDTDTEIDVEHVRCMHL